VGGGGDGDNDGDDNFISCILLIIQIAKFVAKSITMSLNVYTGSSKLT
jgi:hypothetical protein